MGTLFRARTLWLPRLTTIVAGEGIVECASVGGAGTQAEAATRTRRAVPSTRTFLLNGIGCDQGAKNRCPPLSPIILSVRLTTYGVLVVFVFGRASIKA